MASNTPPPGVVDQVARAVADPDHPIVLDEKGQLRGEDINRVIVAYDTFRMGAEPGTWMRNPDTGAMAIRVDDPERGVVWQVTASDGIISYDTEPSLSAPWVELG